MNNNNVFNLQLNKETTTKALNDFILYKIKNGVQQIPILCKSTQTYSNVCAPVSAVLEYYRNLGIHFDIQYTNEDKKAIFVLQSHFDCPLIVEDPDNKGNLQHPFNKVWKFSTEQGIYELASAFVLALRKADTVAEGIIQSVDWCINETILDFDGVNFISSSYADELIGKLIASIGFIQFINHVKLKNISSYSVPIINRSVSQRMAQTYYDNTIPDVTDDESH